jgi:uncharacterized protein YPO0396
MKNMELKEVDLFPPEQFRMSRLQVYNWGTFSGLHHIPIAERGFLFVGRSGTGKSTLLDAFSALLIPPRWIDFNAAAHETDLRSRDRSLVTYVRGAWAEQEDSESGEIAIRYLRSGTTWSALALTYQNKLDQMVILVQLFWIRGNSNGHADIKRHYFIFERPFNLSEFEVFSQSNFDIRKLKNTYPEAFSQDEFRPYCERFRHMLGIESDMALRLLHKTQSAKNLGDLNVFLRDFMLDKPETFEVANRLVDEFGDLNSAHQAVVTAREQIQTLLPARQEYQRLQVFQLNQNRLKELELGLEPYRETRRVELLKLKMLSLETQVDGSLAEIHQQESIVNNHKLNLQDLEHQHREKGGANIEQWETEKLNLASLRTERMRKHDQALDACKALTWTLSDSPLAFAEMVGKARQEIEDWQQNSYKTREKQFSLVNEKKDSEKEFSEVVKEVQALKRQPSNIPSEMLELRREIARTIGVSEEILPFVGELIEVKSDETAWQGAIERVLYGFALSILVGDAHYSAVTHYINHTNLGRRLVYYRTGRPELLQSKSPITSQSLVLKLNVKEGVNAEWLQNELRQRFDYICVDSIQAFRNHDRALTREGQVKHSKTRHEKDDRRLINDRRSWVLGFDNREKLALFEKQAHDLAITIERLSREINLITEQETNRATKVIHCQTLANLQWQEIDVVPLLNRIDSINKQLKATREGNTELQLIHEQLERQKKLIACAETELLESKAKQQNLIKDFNETRRKLESLQNDPLIVPLTDYQRQEFDKRFNNFAKKVQLDNIDPLTTEVLRSINKENEEINKGINVCEKYIENRFADFKRLWPIDASDVDATLNSIPDYFAILTRLETDGLPIHEHRFFELLQNQSDQNLAALSTHLNQARKDILERMELVNESLSLVPFNQTLNQRTYLFIEASDRHLVEVKEFRQEIQQALSHAWLDDRELAESRFLMLRKLVDKLSSQEPIYKRWRDTVLDVRQHVEFIGREKDEGGFEVEIYRSGAGKSGGQRQKLATTCLAAALRYQLGGTEQGMPRYSPVILDEAFDKADNDFTALAMNIFNNFGFQMIVATPLKSVMTLEPFIGGACFVDIVDRRISSVLLIEYDNAQQRLKLPNPVHKDTEVEIS